MPHSLHVSSLGCPLMLLFSWAMKMVTTEVNEEIAHTRHAG